jgi:ABC-type glycerol-3-phosphate transport system permease component
LSALVRAQPTSAGLRPARLLRTLLSHGALVVGSVLFGFPFLWMLSTAFKQSSETFTIPPSLMPASPQWQNFGIAIS